MSYLSRFAAVTVLALVCSNNLVNMPLASAWDSNAKLNPTHPTHSYLTEWAIDQLKAQYPELQQYQNQVIEGANTELHELKVSGTKYGINLEAKRVAHKGTNEGCDDIQGWWQDSITAYKCICTTIFWTKFFPTAKRPATFRTEPPS